jgi:phosphoenolpyruvate synthase/pyruvate phosphate dikinase
MLMPKSNKQHFVEMYQVAALSPLFPSIENGEAYTRVMPELGYYGDRHFIYYHTKGMGTAYFDMEEMRLSGEYTFDLFSEPANFARYVNQVEKSVLDIKAHLNRLPTLDLPSMTDREVHDLLLYNSQIEAHIFALYNVSQPQNFILFEQEIAKRLASKTSDGTLQSHWMGTLTNSEKPTQLSVEELAWLKIIRRAQDSEITDYNHYLIAPEIESHYQQFKFLSLGDGVWIPRVEHFWRNFDSDIQRTKDDIQQRIYDLEHYAEITLASKSELAGELALDEITRYYCEMIAEAGHLRLGMRIEGFIPLASTNGIDIFSAVAERYSLSYKELVFMDYKELTALGSAGSKVTSDILRVRYEGESYLLLVEDNNYTMLYGVAAEERFAALVDAPIEHDSDELTGNIVMVGLVRGHACVFKWGEDIGAAIDGLANDAILVAGQTRPQLMPLIRKCNGIITDEGGVMSHAAIVARELKLPCLVGTKHATKSIRTGDYIELDANTGVVRILERGNITVYAETGQDNIPDKDISILAVKLPYPDKHVETDGLIVSFEDASLAMVDRIGGKGGSLGELVQAGLPVPEGFVLTTKAFNLYSKFALPDAVRELILQSFDHLGAKRVAVRSSAIAEDSVDASWAGQFESVLNVNRDELIQAVETCWESATNELVTEYARDNGVSKDKLALAVVIMRMVDSAVSGVAFTKNPITGDGGEIMIEACLGLGELLVQGIITPDNYIVRRKDSEIVSRLIGSQDKMLVYRGGSNQEVAVSRGTEQKLNDAMIIKLAGLADQIEAYYGSPQDIEWAIEGDRIYIVQSRPITT